MSDNTEIIFNHIKKAFEKGSVIWRQHSLARMLERNISRKDVFIAVQNGNVIEFYPESKPYPGVLIFHCTYKRSLHVVVGWDNESGLAYVITTYIPDNIHFSENGKTRKEGIKK